MKKLFLWIGSGLEEDNGKLSIKRIAFVALISITCFVVVHYTNKDSEMKYDWMQCLPVLSALLGAAFTLVGLTYIPTRNMSPDKPSPDAPAPKQ